MMKKITTVIMLLITALVLVACGNKNDEKTLRVGVVAHPMSTIIELAKEDFEAMGYELKIIRFTDYDIVNRALNDGEIDLNFSQHELFMNQFNETYNGGLVHIQGIYTTPNYLYSTKYNEVSEITANSVIGIAREPINLNRALRFLKQLGLVTFDDNITGNVTLSDITKTVDFTLELFELTGLPQFFADVDAAVMYPSFGMSAGLEVGLDTIAKEEDILKEYDISIVGRADNKDLKIVKDFVSVVASDKTKNYLNDEFGVLYEVVFE